MLSFINVCKNFGIQEVLKNITCDINTNEKIGLIGANGAGKTTFIKLLTGEEELSSGKINRIPGIRIGYVPQNLVLERDITAEFFLLDDYFRIKKQMEEEESRLSNAPPDRINSVLKSYQSVQDKFEEAGGESCIDRIEELVSGLGIGHILHQKISSMSGGEKNVLTLAKALMKRPDILVLDEPGNHLDYAGLEWLEKFLSEFRGAVLIISHNRYLLDHVVTVIFELEKTKLSRYHGNYSQYRLERLRKAAAQQGEYTANRKRIAQLEDLVKRFAQIARQSSSPKWGKRLHAREKQLEREKKQAVKKPELNTSKISLNLSIEKTKADIALQVNSYSRGFGERMLFANAGLQINCGDRVALIGPNGCGKTTFLRDVIEKGSWDDR